MRRLAPAILVLALAAPAFARPQPPDTLTVVTLNLWHDQHDWPARCAWIVAGLRALHPDVVCLQEVLQHPGLPNQAATLAESLGCAWHFVSVDGEDRPKRYGNAILTPHRVLARGGRFLLPLDDWRVAARLRLEMRGRVLEVYDTHLHHTPEGGAIRARQVADLLAYVDSTHGDGELVLAGDFNCELGTAELAPVEARFTDAWSTLHPGAPHADAVTLNDQLGNAPMAIDHVFVPRASADALVPVASEVIFRAPGPGGVWASDHFGVVARFVRAPHGHNRRPPSVAQGRGTP